MGRPRKRRREGEADENITSAVREYDDHIDIVSIVNRPDFEFPTQSRFQDPLHIVEYLSGDDGYTGSESRDPARPYSVEGFHAPAMKYVLPLDSFLSRY
jgi:hypothetical protein